MSELKDKKLNGAKIKVGTIWFLKSLLWLMPILLALDIWSKLGLEQALWDDASATSKTITIIPGFFDIEVLHNRGAAWGMLASSTTFLSILSLLAGIAMIVFLCWKYKKLNWWYRISLYLLIPGALGNLIDRAFSYLAPTSLYRYGVIDFLKFTFGSYVFPTFNLADSYLTIGAIVLIVGTLVSDLKSNKKEDPYGGVKPVENSDKKVEKPEEQSSEVKKEEGSDVQIEGKGQDGKNQSH
ncbi:MAG: signal peptidase II [Bacilli bacterium]|jgi:signal peptidase II|nr:signal peptidase II [Bacilli bacterium]